jgi:pimeloyl-ACP methyl ester carboxylesterase
VNLSVATLISMTEHDGYDHSLARHSRTQAAEKSHEHVDITSFDGTRIGVDVRGAVDPGANVSTVVLIHGFVVNAETNWHQPGITEAIVNAGFRVVAPDLRGHGSSGAPTDAERYGNHALARDVVAVASAFDLSDYHLVGYSLGAITAAHVVGTLADSRVQSVVIGGMGDRLLDRKWSRPPALRDALLGLTGPDSWDPDTAGFMAFVERLGTQKVPLGLVQGGHAHLRAEHRVWKIPTLVLCGADDTVNGSAIELTMALPGAVMQTTPGDHLGALATPEFTAAIVSWLDENA